MAPNGVQADELEANAALQPSVRVETTDWAGMLSTMLVPAVLVTGLIFLLFAPQWGEDDSLDWLDGLVAVIPLEFVRILVLRILRDTYRESASPRDGVRFFLLSMAALLGICLVMAFMAMGMRLFGALADPQTWRFILPPLLLVVFDALVNLVFFRGDRVRVAAQLDAAADDAENWFGLACYPTPIVVIFAYGLVFYLHTRGVALLARVPPPSVELLRAVLIGYAAVYFAGKAILMAHVFSAHFLRSGRRLLGASWVEFLAGRNSEQRAANAREEARATERRLSELRGEAAQPAPSARQRRRQRNDG